MSAASEEIRKLFNGPALAGVGATTDPGLVRSKYHVLPWDPTKKTRVTIAETMTGITLSYGANGKKPASMFGVDTMLKYATYNVDTIANFDAMVNPANGFSMEESTVFKNDLIAILFLMMAYGYYDEECTTEDAEDTKLLAEMEDLNENDTSAVLNVDAINRAATFIMARMHTKYQTNHAIGGSPMQASVASSVRAFYSISPSDRLTGNAQKKAKSYAHMLHWALHPANERLLIPVVIRNTRISSAFVHTNGPEPVLVGLEEYFNLRARTPPASTHMFYVCAAAVKHLESIGILPYLPEPTRVQDVASGFEMISMYGAALHPAARHWGLERVTSNQKLVESLCSDLGYAVRKLIPASSLANAPALAKDDYLNGGWKTFVDALRSAMDERGKEMIDDKIFKEIQERVAPTGKENPAISRVVGYLMAPPTPSSAPGEEDAAKTPLPETPPKQSPKGGSPKGKSTASA